MKYLIDLSKSTCSVQDLNKLRDCIKEYSNKSNSEIIHIESFGYTNYQFHGILIDLEEEDMLMLKLKFNIVTVDYINNEVRLYKHWPYDPHIADEYTIVK